MNRRQKCELFVANLIVKNMVTAILQLVQAGLRISIENPANSLLLGIIYDMLGPWFSSRI